MVAVRGDVGDGAGVVRVTGGVGGSVGVGVGGTVDDTVGGAVGSAVGVGGAVVCLNGVDSRGYWCNISGRLQDNSSSRLRGRRHPTQMPGWRCYVDGSGIPPPYDSQRRCGTRRLCFDRPWCSGSSGETSVWFEIKFGGTRALQSCFLASPLLLCLFAIGVDVGLQVLRVVSFHFFH